MISPRLGVIKAPPPDRLREGEGRAADYWEDRGGGGAYCLPSVSTAGAIFLTSP